MPPKSVDDPDARAAFRARLAATLQTLNVAAIAGDAGLSVATVYRWLSESREPGLFAIQALARRLGVTVSDLLGEGERPLTPYDKDPRLREVVDALEALPDDDSERILAFVEWALSLHAKQEKRHNEPTGRAVQSGTHDTLIDHDDVERSARLVQGSDVFGEMLESPDVVLTGKRKPKRR